VEARTYVPALGDTLIGPIVGVVIVGAVLRVARVERLHTERTAKRSIGDTQGVDSSRRSEQLRGDNHRQGEVAPQLHLISSAHGKVADLMRITW
jgi:hypothetical protein